MKRPPNAMTDEYIRLSLMAGYFARAWDELLLIEHFVPLSYAFRWDLTQDVLDTWKEEALKLGVPVKETEMPEQMKQMFADPDFYKWARKAQADRDRQIGYMEGDDDDAIN